MELLYLKQCRCNFYDDRDRTFWIQPATDHVVAFLDTALQNDYICLLTLSKQQNKWPKIRINPQ